MVMPPSTHAHWMALPKMWAIGRNSSAITGIAPATFSATRRTPTLQPARVHAQINQRANQHVAADARETILFIFPPLVW
jgi:hypothetical protein